MSISQGIIQKEKKRKIKCILIEERMYFKNNFVQFLCFASMTSFGVIISGGLLTSKGAPLCLVQKKPYSLRHW